MKRIIAAALVGLLVFAAGAGRAETVDALIGQLKSDNPETRRAAAKQLGEMGGEARAAGPALIAAARTDKDLFVRRFAAQSLGDVGADAKLAVPALAALVRENTPELTEAAVGSLAKLGAPAVPALMEVLKKKGGANRPKKGDKKTTQTPDKDAFLRAKAAQSLGQIGAAAKPAVPALIDALKDGPIRVGVVNALGEIGPAAKDAVPALREMTTAKGAKKDKSLKQAVNEAIRKIEAKKA